MSMAEERHPIPKPRHRRNSRMCEEGVEGQMAQCLQTPCVVSCVCLSGPCDGTSFRNLPLGKHGAETEVKNNKYRIWIEYQQQQKWNNPTIHESVINAGRSHRYSIFCLDFITWGGRFDQDGCSDFSTPHPHFKM